MENTCRLYILYILYSSIYMTFFSHKHVFCMNKNRTQIETTNDGSHPGTRYQPSAATTALLPLNGTTNTLLL